MRYTNRPFNPSTPYENQVEIELGLANDNFDILRQAFVSDDPTTFIVKRADTVDGFHANLTPAPNTIVPLNASGVLDLSNTYIISNVYVFRRVNLTNATSDYMLQVGEEAVINFTNATSVPLRIATFSGTLYQCFLVCTNNSGVSGGSANPIFLNPNNQTYNNAFVYVDVYRGASVNLASTSATYSAFRCGWAFSRSSFFITNLTQYKNLHGIYSVYGVSGSNPTLFSFSTDWRNTTIEWTSLGTLVFPQATSGFILVRRLY